jgi:hypothetical protein
MQLKNKDQFITVRPITLDGAGNLPTRIEIMQTGDWPNSVKGHLKITLDDISEMKKNFDAGIGFPSDDASTGLPVDFMHDYKNKAGAWIKGLELSIDDKGVGHLFANPVEWTGSGQKAILDGDFKMISPSFWGKAGWPDPRNLKRRIPNVLDGAGLTNIPFLSGMTPIRASTHVDSETGYDDVIYVSKEPTTNKETTMQLDALRVKEIADVTGLEYKFLAENKDQLSADERQKFSLEVKEIEVPVAGKETLSAEDSTLLADLKSGTKKVVLSTETVVEATRLDALEATAEQYRTEKADETVKLHVTRGAIKSDQIDFWTKQLLSSDKEARTALEAGLTALPSNELLAKEIGSGADVAAGSTAREQLSTIASQKVAEAAKEGKELLYGDALKRAARENADLLKQDLVATVGGK